MNSDIFALYPCLKGLEPSDFFRWFGEICRIPHGSRAEQPLSSWLQAFASQRNIPFQTDAAGNLLMWISASEGYADEPPVLLQAHMDMIWAKSPDVDFDFSSQPIPLQVCDNRLTALGTTLGADNAVGMATMLALADGAYPHPPLELLFTTAEEVGLVGIRNFDVQKLQARQMINMDCGDSHVLCVSSAGKISGTVRHTFDLHPIPANFTGLRVDISGSLGGHAGLCANKGLCCAANALGDLLTTLEDFRLCSLSGSRAIMKNASAMIAVPETVESVLKARFETISRVYAQTDPDIQLSLTPCPLPALSPNTEDSRRMVQALSLLRTGQLRADGNDPRYIVTLGILFGIGLTGGDFKLSYSVRSTLGADQQLQFDRCAATVSLLGMELRPEDSYSGWPERINSPFRDKFLSVHKAIFGTDMEIERCPGGIETGVIVDQLPDMDAIGIAPTARGAHTPNEYLLIDEVMPYWQLLTAVLAKKDAT